MSNWVSSVEEMFLDFYLFRCDESLEVQRSGNVKDLLSLQALIAQPASMTSKRPPCVDTHGNCSTDPNCDPNTHHWHSSWSWFC